MVCYAMNKASSTGLLDSMPLSSRTKFEQVKRQARATSRSGRVGESRLTSGCTVEHFAAGRIAAKPPERVAILAAQEAHKGAGCLDRAVWLGSKLLTDDARVRIITQGR